MIGSVSFCVLEREITYTGCELRPHWGLEQTQIYGSLLTAFVGPCEVPTQHLVDMEDRLAADHIRSKLMLHVIGEFFGTTLEAGVLYQRLFMVWAERLLRAKGLNVFRSGDDLFYDERDKNKDESTGKRKLSVSIATVSPVSVLIHWGFNIDATGSPVKAAGFDLLGWNSTQTLNFAKELLTDYVRELEEIRVAQCKVRPIL